MSPAPAEAREIFTVAVEQYLPEQWSTYLDEACGDNLELRKRVELLLEAHVGEESILDSPAIAPPPTIDQPITEKPGTQIGPYKLLQQLGEGGMGVVYMAEQKEPVKRRVALKIIKPGMDTRQVIGRFEAERQALAMMDHPNIAKVLDAGRTDSGRPYFVMELVRGIPVTQYCDEQHLNPKERLELFVPICQAVQHAHQKGIIHRDIKPSNILVALFDGQPVPKVIDFGVAKATSQTLTENTMFTQLGQVVGTLEYMSPEQAQVNQLDVDTRSDVYSLGVLLYELLTGDTPFERTRLRSAAFDEMLRIIREEEPPKPSTKLSSSETLPSIAANRHVNPQRLTSSIRGELDWIVMKALEKDRARRYETASKFAEDVQHYLNDEAVIACPPSRAYRFRKFARRNTAALATSGIVAASLVLGLTGTAWQAFRATHEATRASRAESLAQQRYEDETRSRKEAEEAQTRAEAAEQNERSQRLVAERESTRAKRMANVLFNLTDSANPYSRGLNPSDYTLEQFVMDMSRRLPEQLASEPETLADLLMLTAVWQTKLGYYAEAKRSFDLADALLRGLYGEEHPKVAELLAHKAHYWKFGDVDNEESERTALRALEMSRKFPEKPELNLFCHDRAVQCSQSVEDALTRADEAFAFARMHNLEETLRYAHLLEHTATKQLFHTLYQRRTDAISKKQFEGNLLQIRSWLVRAASIAPLRNTVQLGWNQIRLAKTEFELQRFDEAAKAYREAIEAFGKFGASQSVGECLIGLEQAYRRSGNLPAMQQVLDENVGKGTSFYWLTVAGRLAEKGNTAAYARTCKTVLQDFANSGHPVVMNNVVWMCCLKSGALDEWEPVIDLARRLQSLNSDSAWSQMLVGAVVYRAGDTKAALTELTDARRRLSEMLKTQQLGFQRLHWAFLHCFLAMAHQKLGDNDRAQQLLAVALTLDTAGTGLKFNVALSRDWEMIRDEAKSMIIEAHTQ